MAAPNADGIPKTVYHVYRPQRFLQRHFFSHFHLYIFFEMINKMELTCLNKHMFDKPVPLTSQAPKK